MRFVIPFVALGCYPYRYRTIAFPFRRSPNNTPCAFKRSRLSSRKKSFVCKSLLCPETLSICDGLHTTEQPVVVVGAVAMSIAVLLIMVSAHVVTHFITRRSYLSSVDYYPINTCVSDTASIEGYDEAKAELFDIIDVLKRPSVYSEADGRLPRGVLITGDTGTGKTQLVHEVANAEDISLISIHGSVFHSMDLTETQCLLRRVKSSYPCILLVDHMDTIATHEELETNSLGETNSLACALYTIDRVLNECDDRVLLIGTTTRPLDSTLGRSGRFDRKIHLNVPNVEQRDIIINACSQNMLFDEEVSLEHLSRRTMGFTGADLKTLLNDCVLESVRTNHGVITNTIIQDAFSRHVIGPVFNRKYSDEFRERIAYHEAGHAVIGALCNQFEIVDSVSIQPRASFGGNTIFIQHEDVMLPTAETMRCQIKTLLGGYAAEEIVYGKEEVSVGATNDLAQVYEIAFNVCIKYGFNDFVGKVNMSNHSISNETQFHIESEVRRIVDQLYTFTRNTLQDHRTVFFTVANQLLIDETIHGHDLYKLVNRFK